MVDKIRKALETPITVDYKDMTFDAILEDLTSKVPGLSFRNLIPKRPKMSLRFKEPLPVSAILQALADEAGCAFFVREYGILAATPGHGEPQQAITVQQFLRQSKAGREK